MIYNYRHRILRVVLISSLWFLLGLTPLLSQYRQTVNGNYLTNYGVSPKVLDAAASPLLQDGSYHQNLKIDIVQDGIRDSVKMVILYDPNYQYGKDILIVVEQGSFSVKEKKSIIKAIEQGHSYSRLSRNYLYDESTLKMVRNDGDEEILEFYYQKQDIEPELRDIKRMRGTIIIRNKELYQVVLTNEKPLTGNVDDFERRVTFKRAANAIGHIVTSVQEKFEEDDNGPRTEYVFQYQTFRYVHENGQEIQWETKEEVKSLFNNGYPLDTISVTLGGALPFFGKEATKLGYGLPRPIGINVVRHQQVETLAFSDLQIGFNGGDLFSVGDLFALEESSLSQEVTSYLVRGDVWLFPFLNISGQLGKATANINGSIDLNQETRETLIGLAPLLGLSPSDIPSGLPLDIEVDVNLFGGGATLAGAINNVVLTGSYQFLYAKTPDVNALTVTHTVLPMIGYRTDFGLSVLAGAMGQFYKAGIDGFIPLEEEGSLDYIVEFEPKRWNTILGLNMSVGKHWDLTFQAGLGNRSSSTIQFGYRF